jgi:hypothetical protein
MTQSSNKKQQKKKAKPRGRPFLPGQSGNPKGRPKGALNKFTLAVLGAVETPPKKPGVFLDKTYPYVERGGFYIQRGRKFHPTTKEAMPGPAPDPPHRFDRRRQKWGNDLVYNGKLCMFTPDNGWLFDRTTLLVIE